MATRKGKTILNCVFTKVDYIPEENLVVSTVCKRKKVSRTHSVTTTWFTPQLKLGPREIFSYEKQPILIQDHPIRPMSQLLQASSGANSMEWL